LNSSLKESIQEKKKYGGAKMYEKSFMTSKERVLAAIELKEPDRVPLVPSTRMFGIRYLGYTYEDCYKDLRKYVESQIRLVKEFGHDAVWDWAGMHPIQRAMGQKMLEPEDDVPSPLEPIINDPEDLKKLPKKAQLKGKEIINYHTSITKNLKEQVNDEVPVIAHVSSPFHVACGLRGAQNIYMDMYERPEFVKELVEYLVQPVLEFSELQAEAGADIIYTACPVASRKMISKSHYQEFVNPAHKRLFDYWKNKLGRKTLFHVCGDWSDRFDLVVCSRHLIMSQNGG
jgi:uroporphyrinogen decarboxylase